MGRSGEVRTDKFEALGKSKTEAVQIRVDAKRRFVLEMLARRQERSLASIVEEAVQTWLQSSQATHLREAEAAWSPFVLERFVRQAQQLPDTLTFGERVLYKLICADSRFWFGRTKQPRPIATKLTCDYGLLEQEWDDVCQQAADAVGEEYRKLSAFLEATELNLAMHDEPTPGREPDWALYGRREECRKIMSAKLKS